MNAKRVLIFCLLAISLTIVLTACDTPATDMPPDNSIPQEIVPPAMADTTEANNALENRIEQQIENLQIQIGDTTLTATLADNSSVEALRELLADGPLTIDMSDYGNFEKVGPIGQSLPTNDEQITTEAGDLILYQGSSFVIYYAQNSWNFTRLGKINDVTAEELKEILGVGDVSVTLSLNKKA